MINIKKVYTLNMVIPKAGLASLSFLRSVMACKKIEMN